MLSLQEYSAAQILEAARRAEIEGRAEYAIKFYRHVATAFPRSPEALPAADALTRLTMRAHREPPPTARPERATTALRRDALATEPRDVEPRDVGSRAKEPRIHRSYAVGRSLAHMLEWMGAATAILRLCVMTLALFAPQAHLPALDWFVDMPPLATVLGGVVAVAMGQTMRAVFAMSSAAEELVQLKRSRPMPLRATLPRR